LRDTGDADFGVELLSGVVGAVAWGAGVGWVSPLHQYRVDALTMKE
jgi:hypothetical protein